MKTIRSLPAEPGRLSAYKAANPSNNNWNSFRANDRTAYAELISSLKLIQHGLCAYCEISLATKNCPDHQIEHFFPKGVPAYAHLTLNHQNMLACCCGGGASHFRDPDHFTPPAHENLSCGQKKDTLSIAVEPRSIPPLARLFILLPDGEFEVNDAECTAAGINPAAVTTAIEILGLNCPRLKNARKEVRKRVNKDLETSSASDLARIYLLPDRDNILSQFFTTIRMALQPDAEAILAVMPQVWV